MEERQYTSEDYPLAEASARSAEADNASSTEAALTRLLEAGFLPDQAHRLLHLRDNALEHGEIPPYMSVDPHLQFARWLYERGELNEFSLEEPPQPS